MNYLHNSVLLKESIDNLEVKPSEKYIDCNLGAGGHTLALLKKGAIVLALDVDENAISLCKTKYKEFIDQGNLFIIKKNFFEIDVAVNEIGWKSEEISGILYDLGLSMFQLKEEQKGFSFDDDTSLDMRMDDSLEVTAEDLIRVLPEKELARMFYEYGEEPQSKKYARVIKEYVEDREDITAKEIADLIKNTTKYKGSRMHPATRVFQALRIAVNSELDNLKGSLRRAIPLIKPKGRLVIISFHSLEDAIAKKLQESPALRTIVKTPIMASQSEIDQNVSSRSAKMRVYEKI